MNLVAVYRLLVRRGWVVMPLMVLGGLAGLAYGLTQPWTYEAVSRVAVRPMRPADLGQTQAIKEVMSSYAQDIATLEMAVAVSERLSDDARCAGYDTDPGRLLGLLRVSIDLNVYDIQVKARSRDPAEALCTSEKWAEAFIDRRQKAALQLDPLDRIVTEQRDDTVVGRVWPLRRLIALVGVVVGVLAGGLVVLSLAYIDSAVIRDRADAERLTGAAVIGTVPPGLADGRGGGGPARGVRDAVSKAAMLVGVAWPVLAFAALGALSAYGLSVARPEIHRARTRIAVEPARGTDWGQTQAIREIMKGYSEDIKTRRMAAEVNEALQLDVTPGDLLQKVDVAPKEGVYEIVVDVRDRDQELAKEISRTWAQLFVEQRVRANLALDQRDRILTRLRDQTVAELWSPKRMPNTLAGAALGAVVGAAAAALLQLLAHAYVRTSRDAAQAAEVPVLGSIPPDARQPRGGARP